MRETDKGPSGEGRLLPCWRSPCFYHTMYSYSGFLSSLVLKFPSSLSSGKPSLAPFGLAHSLWALFCRAGAFFPWH